MFCTGIVAFIALIILEIGIIKMVKQLIFMLIKRNYPPNSAALEVDDDVLAEKERINQMTEQELKSEVLVTKNVSKFYGTFCAVNKFSAAIKR